MCVSQSGIHNALKRLNMTCKKKSLKHPNANEEDRVEFQKRIIAYEAKGKSIVPIDESGFVRSIFRTLIFKTRK